jgi:hypothetical protein
MSFIESGAFAPRRPLRYWEIPGPGARPGFIGPAELKKDPPRQEAESPAPQQTPETTKPSSNSSQAPAPTVAEGRVISVSFDPRSLTPAPRESSPNPRTASR